MSDTTVTLTLSIDRKGKASFSGRVTGNGASVDDKGNITVRSDSGADIVFVLDEASAKQWSIADIEFKDKDRQWGGDGKSALTADEADDLVYAGAHVDQQTGTLNFLPGIHETQVRVTDTNTHKAHLKYRVNFVSNDAKATGQFDPSIENTGQNVQFLTAGDLRQTRSGSTRLGAGPA